MMSLGLPRDLSGIRFALNVFIAATIVWYAMERIADTNAIWAIASMVAASDPRVEEAARLFRESQCRALLQETRLTALDGEGLAWFEDPLPHDDLHGHAALAAGMVYLLVMRLVDDWVAAASAALRGCSPQRRRCPRRCRGLLLPQVAVEHGWDLERFVRETGVDTLAISVGIVHGIPGDPLDPARIPGTGAAVLFPSPGGGIRPRPDPGRRPPRRPRPEARAGA